MKILYCSYSQIPSDFANSIAVMKQCEALNCISELRVILIKGKNYKKEDVLSLYGVEKFPLVLLPKWMLCYRELGLKAFVVIYALLFRPDVVYSRDILINEWLCRFHIKNFYEIHQLEQENVEFDHLYKKVLMSVMKKKELQVIVSVSKSLAEECIAFGVPEKKIAVIHSGVDLLECEEAIETNPSFFSEIHPMAVYVGSLQKGKGIELIVQMAKLSSDINFLIVGGNKGQIEERKNLRHIPRVSHKKALSYMKMADFLLLPLTDQRYKFHSPLKLFEYLAMGKPVIASDNADLKEIIVHMENGMLADPSKPEDFLHKIEQVCNDPSLRRHLVGNAKQSASRLTWGARATKIVDLVRRNDEKK